MPTCKWRKWIKLTLCRKRAEDHFHRSPFLESWETTTEKLWWLVCIFSTDSQPHLEGQQRSREPCEQPLQQQLPRNNDGQEQVTKAQMHNSPRDLATARPRAPCCHSAFGSWISGDTKYFNHYGMTSIFFPSLKQLGFMLQPLFVPHQFSSDTTSHLQLSHIAVCTEPTNILRLLQFLHQENDCIWEHATIEPHPMCAEKSRR